MDDARLNKALPSEPSTSDIAWLTFSLAFSDSTRLCRHLRDAYPDPQAAGQLIRRYLTGQDTNLANALCDVITPADLCALHSDSTRRRVEQAMNWQQQHARHHLLGMEHPAYPRLLQDTHDAPPLLYATGSLSALERPLLAVVGSRKASHNALALTRSLSGELALAGLGIVSGLALGIDAAAHEGALEAWDSASDFDRNSGGDGDRACGATIAIAATPSNRVYPKRHAALAERIMASGGLILTEYALGTPTRPWCFPRRNRIISGISLGVLVAEAGLPSGTMTTATHAMNQGREVMAVPGSVHNVHARGCHALIKQGAALVENAVDILDSLGQISGHASCPLVASASDTLRSRHGDNPVQNNQDSPLLEPEERSLLECLSSDSATIDELMTRTTLPVSELSAVLGLLEIRGLVTTTAGGRYTRC